MGRLTEAIKEYREAKKQEVDTEGKEMDLKFQTADTVIPTISDIDTKF